MKKTICILLSLAIMLLGGCSGTEVNPQSGVPLTRMIKINDEIYCETGNLSSLTPRCGTMDGEITSKVEPDKIPTDNNQSNFGNNFGYQIGAIENQIEIYYNGNWEIFDKSLKCIGVPLDWGLTLTAKDITKSGLTLVFLQNGGAPQGTLQTGSAFTIEKKNSKKWEEVPRLCIDSNCNFAFEDVAYVIAKNRETELRVDWSWSYGQLPPGEYRIRKEIDDFIKAQKLKKGIYFAYFTLE